MIDRIDADQRTDVRPAFVPGATALECVRHAGMPAFEEPLDMTGREQGRSKASI